MEITSTTVTSGTASTDSTIDLIFTSSEATTDFTESDISVTNGSLSNFTTNDGFIISRIDHNDTNPNYSSPVTDNTFTIWDSAPDDGTLSVSFTNENTFTLGGEQYTGITLQSNGWLQFGATNIWYGDLVLLQNTPSIAIPWDDYNTVGNSDLGIGYKYSADDTQFIVSYDTHEWGNTTDVQIMVTLNLDSHSEPGTIRIDYGKLENNAGLVGVSYGLGSSESTLIEVDYLTITEPEFVAYPNIPYKNYGTDIQNFEYKTLIFSKVPEGYRATLTPSGEGLCTVNVAGDTFTDLAGNGNTATTPFTWTYLTVSINYVKLSMTESSTYHAAHPAYGNSVVNSNFIILFDLKIFINDVDVATSASLSRSSALNGSLEATNITDGNDSTMYHSASNSNENWVLIELDSTYSLNDLQAIRLFGEDDDGRRNFFLRGITIDILDEQQTVLNSSTVPITFADGNSNPGSASESIRLRYNSSTTTAPSASDADEELIVT